MCVDETVGARRHTRIGVLDEVQRNTLEKLRKERRTFSMRSVVFELNTNTLHATTK